MRKLMLIFLVVAAAFVAVYRQRLFLRDPLGRMEVRGVEAAGARVFINYSNDVLVMRDGEPAVMVQGWDRTPGLPRRLACMRTMFCWTEKDEAEKIPLGGGGAYEPRTSMGNREVTYVDADGAAVRVVIR